MSPSQDRDWIDLLVDAAARLGLNRVRVRWKLEGLRRSLDLRKRRVRGNLEYFRYQHTICPKCGALMDQSATHCLRCGGYLPGVAAKVVQRSGLSLQGWTNATRLLMVLMVLPYIWVFVQGAHSSLIDLDARDLIRWGGNFPPATLRGGWWRLASYMFLHAGLWHIGFNMFALHIVGPLAETRYGWGRTLMAFWVCGVVAGLASLLFSGGGVSIGASGSIMGLIGLMGTWGHRSGTPTGRHIRSLMVRWIIYTAVFGFFIGADNAAHAGGLLAGVGMGLLLKPDRRAARWGEPLAWVGWLAPLLLLATLASIPLTPRIEGLLGVDLGLEQRSDAQALRETEEVLSQACTRWEHGDRKGALHVYDRFLQRRGLVLKDDAMLERVVGSACRSWSAMRRGEEPVFPEEGPQE